jgi:hypothetical protein
MHSITAKQAIGGNNFIYEMHWADPGQMLYQNQNTSKSPQLLYIFKKLGFH